MAEAGRKRGDRDRPEYQRSSSKRSRDGMARGRIADTTSVDSQRHHDDVVHRFLRRPARAGENSSRSCHPEDESVSDTLAGMAVISSEPESSRETLEPSQSQHTESEEPSEFEVRPDIDHEFEEATPTPSAPRTPLLGHQPAGLNNSLQRVSSLIFRYDPDRISLASSKRSAEDRTPSVRDATGSLAGAVDDNAVDASAGDVGVSLRHNDGDARKKRRKFRFRKSLKKIRRRLGKQSSRDEGGHAFPLELLNGEAETSHRTEMERRDDEEIVGSQSSQDSGTEKIPGMEKPSLKKKIGVMQRLSAWFGGKKEIMPVTQKQTDMDEQYFQRKSSYRRAIETGRWASVYISGSSTDDEASDDEDLGEVSQEILADSAKNSSEVEAEREEVVDRLQEMGTWIEDQFRDQLVEAAKKLDISSALPYSVFSKVAGVFVQGGKMTTAGLMKLLVFGRQLVTGVPQELASMMEQYTSQAVEDYASDYIRSNGGWGGIAEDTEAITSSEETAKSLEL